MASDNSVSFSSFNFPGSFIRHKNFLAELEVISSALDQLDATFIFHPGLAGGDRTGSWESRNISGFWLRHQDFRLKLQQRPPGLPEQEQFDKDATFFILGGLANNSGHHFSYKPVGITNMFLRHRDGHLVIQELDLSNDLDKADATFKAVDGFVPEETRER